MKNKSYDPLREKIEQAKESLVLEEEEEEEPYYEFCEYYELEDGIQNNLFNQEFNEPHLRWIFIDPETGKKTPPLTDDFLYAISTRIYNISHINIFIFGPTDSGKSEGAQSLGDYYEKEFYRIQNIKVDIPIIFSDADLDEISPTIKYGDMVIRDESSNVTGEESGILKIKVGNLIRAIRVEQNSFIYVNPDIIDVPLVDYYLRTAGKKGIYYCSNCDKEYINIRRCPECYSDLETVYSKCKTRFILYYRQVDPLTNKAYFIPLGRIYLGLHTNKELRAEYERRKRKNAIRLKKMSGLVPVHRNEEKLEKEAQILAQVCLNENVFTKIGMEVIMIKYNSQFAKDIDEAHKMIGGTTKHNRLLFERTSQILDKLQTQGDILSEESQEDKKSEQKSFEAFKDYIFPYSKADIIKKAKKNAHFRDVNRDFEIYFKAKDNIMYEDIVPYYSFNDPTNISHIVDKVQGLLNRISGDLFEADYVKHLQTIYEDKVIHDGRKGEPDAYVIVEALNELHVFSLKNISIYALSRDKVKPEQDFAFNNRLKYKKVRLFYIAYINNKIFVKEETNLGATGKINFK